MGSQFLALMRLKGKREGKNARFEISISKIVGEKTFKGNEMGKIGIEAKT